MLFGCLFKNYLLVREIMCTFFWKKKLSVVVTSVGHYLSMASRFVIQHCGSFPPSSRDVAFHKRGNLVEMLHLHTRLQLFKNELYNCQHGVLTKCLFWRSWTLWIYLDIQKLMVHFCVLHQSFSADRVGSVVNVSIPTRTGKGSKLLTRHQKIDEGGHSVPYLL